MKKTGVKVSIAGLKSGAVQFNRCSSRNKVDGGSLPRQSAAGSAVAKRLKVNVKDRCVHFGVSGRIPLGQRPGVLALLAWSKKNKTMTWLFEDETRLARTVESHIASKKWAREHGIRLVHSGLPDLWDSDEPEQEFVDIVLAGQSQMAARKTWKTLHNARERKRPTSTRRTIAGKRKIEGRKRMSEIHVNLPQVLGSLLQRPYYKRKGIDGKIKTLPIIAAYLKSKGVATKARYTVDTNGQKVMVTKPGQALNKGAVSKLLRQV